MKLSVAEGCFQLFQSATPTHLLPPPLIFNQGCSSIHGKDANKSKYKKNEWSKKTKNNKRISEKPKEKNK